jgi:hypothetical protein
MKRPVCLRLCLTVLLVLVIGSVLSLSGMNMLGANDMTDAPITKDTITAGSDGDNGEEEDQGDD